MAISFISLASYVTRFPISKSHLAPLPFMFCNSNLMLANASLADLTLPLCTFLAWDLHDRHQHKNCKDTFEELCSLRRSEKFFEVFFSLQEKKMNVTNSNLQTNWRSKGTKLFKKGRHMHEFPYASVQDWRSILSDFLERKPELSIHFSLERLKGKPLKAPFNTWSLSVVQFIIVFTACMVILPRTPFPFTNIEGLERCLSGNF